MSLSLIAYTFSSILQTIGKVYSECEQSLVDRVVFTWSFLKHNDKQSRLAHLPLTAFPYYFDAVNLFIHSVPTAQTSEDC